MSLNTNGAGSAVYLVWMSGRLISCPKEVWKTLDKTSNVNNNLSFICKYVYGFKMIEGMRNESSENVHV